VSSVCDVAACPAPDPTLVGTPVRACVAGVDGQVCGYACENGLLKCEQGCCQAKAVAAGARHTCAIAAAPADGDLFCWGANEAGQAAPDVESAVYSIPRRVRGGVSAVALGDHHTCAILAGTGAVVCWGLASDGRLGPGGAPVAANATAIAAGIAHTCAVVAGGVQCWGNALDGKLGAGGQPFSAGAGATAVAAGASHSCAVVGGAVRCWGAGADGQLGDGLQAGSEGPVTAAGITTATLVAARENYTCAGMSAGDQSLQCWGRAPGLYDPVNPPTTLIAPAVPARRFRGNERDPVVGAGVTLLGAGRAHACVQDGIGSAIACFGGNNLLGQLGDVLEPGDSSTEILFTTAASSLAVGGDHGCAVIADGSVWCWGANDKGQLGNGSTIRPLVGVLAPVAGR
jgi:hypothetical protein